MKATLTLTIGALSRQTDVSVDTIRYYERIGLLPKPTRSAGGHRTYTREQVRRLMFIRRSRALGFSLVDVSALLGLSDGRHVTCAKVKKITEQRIAEIRQRLKELRRLERVLTSMVAQCSGGEVGDCQILDALARK
jgi:MerR family transcriptional regulator, mercuric resistance operon regulatory protein